MEVKINKSNNQKYVTIPKESPLKEGDDIEIILKFGGVYNKKSLEEYNNNNESRLKDLKEKLNLNHKKHFESAEWKFFTEELSIILGLGKMERLFEEGVCFENADDYDYSPFGDTDGGIMGELYNFSQITRLLKMRQNKEYQLDNPKCFNSNLNSIAKVKYMQLVEERIIDSYQSGMNGICKTYNFEPVELDSCDLDEVYFDGKVYLTFCEGKICGMSISDYHKTESLSIK